MIAFRSRPSKIIVACLAVGAAAAATAPAALAAPAHSRSVQAPIRRTSIPPGGHSAASVSESNWSGYARRSTPGSFNEVSGNWTVPSVSTAHDGLSSTWVGIDGDAADDGYLVQTGTTADVTDGRASYSAWWEVIVPSKLNPEMDFNITVRPGDKMHAWVRKGKSSKWTMGLQDYTTNKRVTHTSTVSARGETAEWIQEDTSLFDGVSVQVQPAPNWHSVTFSNLTLNGAGPHLTYGEHLNLADGNGTQEDSTGRPNSAGDGFTVTWITSGTTWEFAP